MAQSGHEPAAARQANEQGLAHAEQARWEEAEQAFRQALRADGAFAPAHNNLGLVLLQRGEVYEAAVEFRAASKHDSHATEPLVNLGRLYETIGWRAAAAREYERATDGASRARARQRLAGADR